MLKNRILITGAAGFIGSHLTEKLVTLGYKVVAFDRYRGKCNLLLILLLLPFARGLTASSFPELITV